ncbi:phage exclusion protein Lit family protein [Confluentibacter sediminis]|uniref:phage exclusion protein Lit family protein n=1 Tax=Confluentibacter sediminis TaxID=2219045 RepID=UPI000DAE0893|nr:phage exclusion protein Lit family protein [Confluentibacter sediminis]
MLCNNFTNGIDNQHGDQPIRVFYNLIESYFIGIKEALTNLRPNDNVLSKVRLEYLTENIRVIGPSTNGLKITLHDSFLSFLWTNIYSIIVTTPSGGKEVTLDENKQARELRKYGISLKQQYSAWDKETMPNPELHPKDPKRLIGVSNAVFLSAVQFILLHEFAHVFLGHPFVPLKERTSENLRKMEVDADNFAIMWAMDSSSPDNKFTDNIAWIAALNSLSYTPNKFSDTKIHPAPEDRIILCLERLNLKEDDYLWSYALWSIMEWQTNFELFHIPKYKVGDNFKKHFYDMIKELKEYKKKLV